MASHPAFKALLSDRTHGASVLTRQLLNHFKSLELEPRQARAGIQACREQVRRAHPAMVALDAALAHILEEAQNTATVGAAAAAVERRWREALNRVVAQAARLVREQRRVMTISHSGIVRDALLAAKEAGIAVWVGEGRPQCEGLELARELADAGIQCTVYADMAFGEFLPEVGLALVGADAVSDDAFVNKTGTRVLLAMARAAGVRTAVAYDPLKLVGTRPLPLEQAHAPEEIMEPGADRITVVNRWFEAVPLALADEVITATMGAPE